MKPLPTPTDEQVRAHHSYYATQLGRVAAGLAYAVHSSTLLSLQRRGLVDGRRRLTDEGRRLLAVAQSERRP